MLINVLNTADHDPSTAAKSMTKAAQKLSEAVDSLKFTSPVACVYNPLDYAGRAHHAYIRKCCPPAGNCKAVFLGMNPGPWGMAQTGVPFGEIDAVRNWIGIEEKVDQPLIQHPKRPIEGFDCRRSEVSGRRLWGLFAKNWPSAEDFFTHHFVLNYCPLVFMSESGSNITPDKLPVTSRILLEAACDEHLLSAIRILNPQWVVGVGGWATKCAERVVANIPIPPLIGTLLHPSPASPVANREWPTKPTAQLKAMGLLHS